MRISGRRIAEWAERLDQSRIVPSSRSEHARSAGCTTVGMTYHGATPAGVLREFEVIHCSSISRRFYLWTGRTTALLAIPD
jgi:hypothetical protein